LAFVIMPNHVHAILYITDETTDLNKAMANGKRFMSYSIIGRLEDQQNTSLLYKLQMACSDKEKAKGQKHKVFEVSFDAKYIYSVDFLYQKIDYIHHNPVNGKWNLCAEFVDYKHSSAAYYELERVHPFITIADYRDYWF
jgi:REP element-mobilizing transposase RayT